MLNLIATISLMVASVLPNAPTPLTAEERFSVLEQMYKAKTIEAEHYRASEAMLRLRIASETQNKEIEQLLDNLRHKHNAAGHNLGEKMEWVKPQIEGRK